MRRSKTHPPPISSDACVCFAIRMYSIDTVSSSLAESELMELRILRMRRKISDSV